MHGDCGGKYPALAGSTHTDHSFGCHADSQNLGSNIPELMSERQQVLTVCSNEWMPTRSLEFSHICLHQNFLNKHEKHTPYKLHHMFGPSLDLIL